MRILIITQKIDINDDVLGFFHGWVEGFAEKLEDVRVIANYVGEYKFPANVKFFSLGKERGYSRLRRYFRFYKFLFQNIKKIDAVFFHMCPEYVLAGGIIARLFKKKIGFWYAHGAVTLRLKIADKIADYIFTSSEKGCRLKSKKIIITGQGIDTGKFKAQSEKRKTYERFKIISAGRIAPVKNYEILIEVAEILKKENINFDIRIAGSAPLDKDKVYFERLKNMVRERGLEERVFFIGSVAHKNVVDFYQDGDLLINLSQTGSMDKVVLEAMASGLPVLNSNEAYFKILDKRHLTKNDSQEIVEKILYFIKNKINFAPELREIVIKDHSLNGLIEKIISGLRGLCGSDNK